MDLVAPGMGPEFGYKACDNGCKFENNSWLAGCLYSIRLVYFTPGAKITRDPTFEKCIDECGERGCCGRSKDGAWPGEAACRRDSCAGGNCCFKSGKVCARACGAWFKRPPPSASPQAPQPAPPKAQPLPPVTEAATVTVATVGAGLAATGATVAAVTTVAAPALGNLGVILGSETAGGAAEAILSLGIADALQQLSITGRFFPRHTAMAQLLGTFDFANLWLPLPAALATNSSKTEQAQAHQQRTRHLFAPEEKTQNRTSSSATPSDPSALSDQMSSIFLGNVFWVAVIVAAEVVALLIVDRAFCARCCSCFCARCCCGRRCTTLHRTQYMARKMIIHTISLTFHGLCITSVTVIAHVDSQTRKQDDAFNLVVNVILAFVVAGLVTLLYPGLLGYFIFQRVRPRKLETHEQRIGRLQLAQRASALLKKAEHPNASSPAASVKKWEDRAKTLMRELSGGDGDGGGAPAGAEIPPTAPRPTSSRITVAAKAMALLAPAPAAPAPERQRRELESELRQVRRGLQKEKWRHFRTGTLALRAVGQTIVYDRCVDPGLERIWSHAKSSGCCFTWCRACVYRHRCRGVPVTRGHWTRPADRSSTLVTSHIIMFDGSRWYWGYASPLFSLLRAVLAALSEFDDPSAAKPPAMNGTVATDWTDGGAPLSSSSSLRKVGPLAGLVALEVALLLAYIVDDPFRVRHDMWLSYVCQVFTILAGVASLVILVHLFDSANGSDATGGAGAAAVVMVIHCLGILARTAIFIKRWREGRRMKRENARSIAMRERRLDAGVDDTHKQHVIVADGSYLFSRPHLGNSPPPDDLALAGAALASGWEEHVDAASGEKYYFNRKTMASTWTRPVRNLMREPQSAATSTKSRASARHGRNRDSGSRSSRGRGENLKVAIKSTEAGPRVPDDMEQVDPWDEFIDRKSGRRYFVARNSGVASWDRPMRALEPISPSAAAVASSIGANFEAMPLATRSKPDESKL